MAFCLQTEINKKNLKNTLNSINWHSMNQGSPLQWGGGGVIRPVTLIEKNKDLFLHLINNTFASATFNFYIMIYGFEFSINKGTASSKPCLWPKTDTECQVWAQILRSTFLKLVLERVKMSTKKYLKHFFKHDKTFTFFFSQ